MAEARELAKFKAGKVNEMTFSFLRDECLTDLMREGKTADEVADLLGGLKRLRLAWKNVAAIDNLDFFTNLTEVYLQHNRIERIDNLHEHCCSKVTMLSLSNNRITAVEGLVQLKSLEFLDLSENAIASVEGNEFPKALMILNMSGNDCVRVKGYHRAVASGLPKLTELDLDPIDRDEDGDYVEKPDYREHPLVKEAIDKFWNIRDLPKTDDECLVEAPFLNLNFKLHLALAPDDTEAEARFAGQEDWRRDSRGAETIDYPAFFESIYEIAEFWCDDADSDSAATEYVTFLRSLLHQIADGLGDNMTFKPDGDISGCLAPAGEEDSDPAISELIFKLQQQRDELMRDGPEDEGGAGGGGGGGGDDAGLGEGLEEVRALRAKIASRREQAMGEKETEYRSRLELEAKKGERAMAEKRAQLQSLRGKCSLLEMQTDMQKRLQELKEEVQAKEGASSPGKAMRK